MNSDLIPIKTKITFLQIYLCFKLWKLFGTLNLKYLQQLRLHNNFQLNTKQNKKTLLIQNLHANAHIKLHILYTESNLLQR